MHRQEHLASRDQQVSPSNSPELGPRVQPRDQRKWAIQEHMVREACKFFTLDFRQGRKIYKDVTPVAGRVIDLIVYLTYGVLI